MSWIASSPEGAVLNVRVVPRASRNQVQGLHGDALKIRLQAPPVEGKANAALVAFLAETVGVPKRDVLLMSGAASRHKRVRVRGLAPSLVAARLGLRGAVPA